MTETCLTYLSLTPLREGPCKDNVTLRDRLERYPFLRYAALNWGFHAQGDTEKICCTQILDFLSQDGLRASALQASKVITHNPAMEMHKLWSVDYPKGRSGLAMAATFGLTSIVQCLVEITEDIDVGDNEKTTALMCAAGAGHKNTLGILLDAGANIEKADVSGSTALIAAASNDCIEAVKLLLAKGANIDAETVYRQTSLYMAVWRGYQPTVMLLLDEGANVKASHNLMQAAVFGGHTAMIELASRLTGQTQNNEEIKSSLLSRIHYNRPSIANVEILIEKGASLTQMSYDGYTPIHLASQKGHLEAVRLFLDHGVPPDIMDKAGHTPLHFASFRGSLETVELLLERGANIMAQNHAGETALHTCLRYLPDEDVVSLLLIRGHKIDVSNARGQTPLHTAARRRHCSIVKVLIAHGANAKLETHGGWTPLEEAAASGAKDIVGMLGEHGSDDRSHRYVDLLASACLREAISSQDLGTIKELLTKPDIDTDLPDCDGRTSLHHAAYNGQTEVAVALLNRGASVHAKIDDSAYNDAYYFIGHIPHEIYQQQWVTPLHNAAGKGHADIVKILLNHGSNVNAVGSEGYTVLDIAVHEGHANVAKLLLECGSAIEKSEDGGEPTLLYWAVSSGYEDVVRVLLEHGADEGRHGEWGKKALVNAVRRNSTGVVKLLKDHGFSAGER